MQAPLILLGHIQAHCWWEKKVSSWGGQNNPHKGFVVHLDPTAALGIMLSESLGQRLHNDTGAHESIKSDRRRWPCTAMFGHWAGCVLQDEQPDQTRGKVVAELAERPGHLILVDRSRPISIEVVENALPVLDVFPEARELVEAYGTISICIEDRHKELDGVNVERSPIAIQQGSVQFFGGNSP